MNRLFLNSFKKVDIFGSEITLNYNKDNLFRTPFGGVVAIICVCALVLLFFNNVITLIGKTEVTFISSTQYDPDPDLFQVGHNQMMIAVKYDQTDFLKRPQMNVTFEKRQYTRYDNGTYVQKKIPVALEPCTYEHFYDLPNYNMNWTYRFDLSEVSDYLCLKKGENFNVGGTYESKEFYHIKFVLKKCVNQTNPVESWKPICDTPENISKNNEDARIKFLFSNTLLKPEEPSNPVQTFQDALIFNVQPQKMYTTANIMLNEQAMRTDESVTIFHDYTWQNFVSYKSGEFKQQIAVGNYTNYSEIFFLRSNFSTLVKRTFLKIDQVISYMGGFCQVFLLVSAIIVSQFNEYVYNIELANKLYDFDIRQKSDRLSSSPKARNRFSPSISYKQALKQGNSTESPRAQNRMIEQELGVPTNELANSQLNKITKAESLHMKQYNLPKNIGIEKQSSGIIMNLQNLSNKNDFVSSVKELNTQLSSRCLEDNLTTQRLDSFRPFSPFSADTKNALFSSKQNTLKQKQLHTVLKNEANQRSDFKQEDEDVIDIDQINGSMKDVMKDPTKQLQPIKLQRDSSSFNNTDPNVNKSNLNKLNFMRGGNTSKEVQSEGNLQNKIEDYQQQNLSQKEMQSFSRKRDSHEKSIIDNNQFLEQELKQIIQRDRTLWLDVKYFINKLTCGKFCNTYEVQLLNKALDKVKEDLDIFMILDRQKEIEKFKRLFLTPDQQVLFNFFPKQLISVNQEQILLSRQSLKVDDSRKSNSLKPKKNLTQKGLNISFKNIAIVSKAVQRFKLGLTNSKMSDYQQLYNCYERIISNSKSEVEKETNKKLIEHLGQEMNSIFELAYRMKQKKQTDKGLGLSNSIRLNQTQQKKDNPSLFKNMIKHQSGNAADCEEYVQELTPKNFTKEDERRESPLQIKEIFLAQPNKMMNVQDIENQNKYEEQHAKSKQEDNGNNLILFEQEEFEEQSQKD